MAVIANAVAVLGRGQVRSVRGKLSRLIPWLYHTVWASKALAENRVCNASCRGES